MCEGVISFSCNLMSGVPWPMDAPLFHTPRTESSASLHWAPLRVALYTQRGSKAKCPVKLLLKGLNSEVQATGAQECSLL